jgi:lysophospholipase L1-like esterase
MTYLRKRLVLWSTLFIMPFLFLFLIEMGTRVVQSFKVGNSEPLFYGGVELHRFLFEDKAENLRKQGNFYVQKQDLKLEMFDSTQGDIYRDQYYAFKKKTGAYRIIVFGGSSVYSVTTSKSGSFPAVLESLFNNLEGQNRYEVINMGESGIMSSGIRKHSQPAALRFEHDMEIFYHLSNDFFRPVVTEQLQESFLNRINNIFYRISAAYSACKNIWARITGKGFISEHLKEQHKNYYDNVESMIKAAKTRGITPVIVKQALDLKFNSTTDGRYPGLVEIYEQSLLSLDEIAKKYNILILDAANMLTHEKTSTEQKEIFHDVVHLTAKGNAELAKIIYTGLIAETTQ